MRSWYRPHDLLPGGVETVIPADSSLAETVERVMRESGLAAMADRDNGIRSATT
ncbi:hypothetical protein [Streptomyces orinoci]|uniref:CBS domain-containing protein n=1 Tax=Streptomyces orinoci TaxID=67339 RepID=A0ABV3JZ59_STRON